MATESLQKYLDDIGLTQVWSEIISQVYTPLGNKLAKIADGAQVNVIEGVQVNGVDLEVTGKKVNVIVPTGTLASLDKVGKEQLDETLTELITKLQNATTLSGYGITDAYTKTEVDNKIKSAVAGVYKIKGSIAFADLPVEGMKDGDLYNITDAFTSTNAFVEGSGKEYPAGTNVAYVAEQGKWDCMAGTYDFSGYLQKSEIRNLTSEEISAICTISNE